MTLPAIRPQQVTRWRARGFGLFTAGLVLGLAAGHYWPAAKPAKPHGVLRAQYFRQCMLQELTSVEGCEDAVERKFDPGRSY